MKLPIERPGQNGLPLNDAGLTFGIPGIAVLVVRPNALKDGKRFRAVKPHRVAKVVGIDLGRNGAEHTGIAIQDLIAFMPILEFCSLSNLITDRIDDVHHGLGIVQADDDDFRVIQRVKHPNGIGKRRPLRIIFNANDVPSESVDIVDHSLLIRIVTSGANHDRLAQQCVGFGSAILRFWPDKDFVQDSRSRMARIEISQTRPLISQSYFATVPGAIRPDSGLLAVA